MPKQTNLADLLGVVVRNILEVAIMVFGLIKIFRSESWLGLAGGIILLIFVVLYSTWGPKGKP